MAEGSLHTTQLRDLIDRVQAGDPAAQNELLTAAGARLERLARRMLRQFPNVGRWADADDVLQDSTVRLLRTLRAVRPTSTAGFFNLAAVHIRRELLDLARHFGGRHGLGARHDTPSPGAPANALEVAQDQRDTADDLEEWGLFHEAVERLPVEEREVVGLAFYHGWTHAQIAELLQVTDRTVRRYWQSACLRLNAALGGRLPGRIGPPRVTKLSGPAGHLR